MRTHVELIRMGKKSVGKLYSMYGIRRTSKVE